MTGGEKETEEREREKERRDRGREREEEAEREKGKGGRKREVMRRWGLGEKGERIEGRCRERPVCGCPNKNIPSPTQHGGMAVKTSSCSEQLSALL